MVGKFRGFLVTFFEVLEKIEIRNNDIMDGLLVSDGNGVNHLKPNFHTNRQYQQIY